MAMWQSPFRAGNPGCQHPSMPAPTAAALDRIPGWFRPTDQRLFERFLSAGTQGDLLELGTYLGKSAVLIGGHLRPGESFTVCDLFESEAPDAANEAETTGSYSTLTRQRFEQNYLSVHDSLPEIVHGPSSRSGRRSPGSDCPRSASARRSCTPRGAIPRPSSGACWRGWPPPPSCGARRRT